METLNDIDHIQIESGSSDKGMSLDEQDAGYVIEENNNNDTIRPQSVDDASYWIFPPLPQFLDMIRQSMPVIATDWKRIRPVFPLKKFICDPKIAGHHTTGSIQCLASRQTYTSKQYVKFTNTSTLTSIGNCTRAHRYLVRGLEDVELLLILLAQLQHWQYTKSWFVLEPLGCIILKLLGCTYFLKPLIRNHSRACFYSHREKSQRLPLSVLTRKRELRDVYRKTSVRISCLMPYGDED